MRRMSHIPHYRRRAERDALQLKTVFAKDCSGCREWFVIFPRWGQTSVLRKFLFMPTRHSILGITLWKAVDKNSNSEASREVSPYLLRPPRDLQRVQLESTIRKARANGWARNEHGSEGSEEVLRAVRTAFPDMSLAEANAAIRRLSKP